MGNGFSYWRKGISLLWAVLLGGQSCLSAQPLHQDAQPIVFQENLIEGAPSSSPASSPVAEETEELPPQKETFIQKLYKAKEWLYAHRPGWKWGMGAVVGIGVGTALFCLYKFKPSLFRYRPAFLFGKRGAVPSPSMLLPHVNVSKEKIESSPNFIGLELNKGRLAVKPMPWEDGRPLFNDTRPLTKPTVNDRDPFGNSRLGRAILLGDKYKFKEILSLKPDLEARNEKGETPLHLAVRMGFENEVKILLEAGAEAEAKNKGGEDPLSMAKQLKHRRIVALLEKHRGLPLSEEEREKEEVKEEIKEKGKEKEEKKLEFLEVAKAISRGGAPEREDWEELKKGVQQVDEKGQTLLHIAACYGQVKWVEELLKNGAQINTQDKEGGSPLHVAIHQHEPQVATLLMEKGAHVGQQDGKGNSPLHIAVMKGDMTCVDLLLGKGADPLLENKYNQSPLALVELYPNPAIKGAFLNHLNKPDLEGAKEITPKEEKGKEKEIDLKKEKEKEKEREDEAEEEPEEKKIIAPPYVISKPKGLGWYSMSMSMFNHMNLEIDLKEKILYSKFTSIILNMHGKPKTEEEKEELITDFIKVGGHINSGDEEWDTLMHSAAIHGKKEWVEALIHHGADVNVRNKKGKTPLHVALKNREYEMINLLLKKGAQMNEKDRRGNTPLHVALENNDYEIINLLLKKGAKINEKDRRGNTPLHLALQIPTIIREKDEIIRLLLSKKVNLDLADKEGKTPLHIAISSGNLELAKIFIEKGCEVNGQDKDRNTPLHLALQIPSGIRERDEIIRLLLSKGVNLDLADKEGKTPLHIAISAWNFDRAKIFLEQECEVNGQDKNGNTPLHLALQIPTEIRGKKEIIDCLLLNGVNLNLANKEGKTPLHIAISAWNFELAKIFLEQGCEVNGQDNEGNTPLHLALQIPTRIRGKKEIIDLLLHREDIKLMGFPQKCEKLTALLLEKGFLPN
jgi:ankyrin repeat protein